MKQAVLGAGATAATLGAGTLGLTAAEEDDANPIRVPAEFEAAKTAPLPTVEFPMTGAQVFARACKEEGGRGALLLSRQLHGGPRDLRYRDSGPMGVGTRGALCHAADAFCRVTGEIVATSGTEGPGFTDMICGIAAANAARSPILVLASNKTIFAEDTERGIQDGYQQPTTEGMRKYGKRLITAARIHEYRRLRVQTAAERCAKAGPSGLPGRDRERPISGCQRDRVLLRQDEVSDRHQAAPGSPGDRPSGRAAAGGRAPDHRVGATVCSTAVRGTRCAGWPSGPRFRSSSRARPRDSFRPATSCPPMRPRARLASADLVLLVGQYCMPTLGEFAFGPDTKYIRIDPSAEDIGRNLPIELGIVSDERVALEALADAVGRMRHRAWVAEVAAARAKFEAENEQYYQTGLGYTDAVHPAVIGKELADFLQAGSLPRDRTTIAQGGYGIARYTRRYLRAFRPGQIMNGAYQYGAIGPDVGYTLGVAAAVQQGTGPQGRLSGSPGDRHHRRRRVWLHRHGARDDGQVSPARDCHRLQQQRLGHLERGSATTRSGFRCTCSKRTSATTRWARRSARTANM